MNSSTCNVDGCPGPAWPNSALGFCYGHEQKAMAIARRAALPKKPIGRPRINNGPCKSEGCDNPATVKGFCKTCDQRIRRQFG